MEGFSSNVLMAEGSRTVFNSLQGSLGFPCKVSGKLRGIICWGGVGGGEIAAGSARLGVHWGLGRNEGCLPLVQLAVDEVLGLVGGGAG